MAAEAEAARVWYRLGRTAPFLAIREGWNSPYYDPHVMYGPSWEVNTWSQYEMAQALMEIYNIPIRERYEIAEHNLDLSNLDQAMSHDREFLKAALMRAAERLAEKTLNKMHEIRLSLWNRYLLTGGEDGGLMATKNNEVTSFARKLAAYLVYTSDSHYPALLEDIPALQATVYGVPHLPYQLPGGGVPDDLTEEEFRQYQLATQARWRRWNSVENPDQRFASYQIGGTQSHSGINDALTADQIRHKLLSPEEDGHPILALVGKFRTPHQVYEILKLSQEERTTRLRQLIREIEQFLLCGETEFDRARGQRDWKTLHPLLDAAKWQLFPDGPGRNPNVRRPMPDAPLHALADFIIEHDPEFNPWSWSERLFAAALGVSIVLTLVTFGASAPATAGAVAVIDTALGVAATAVDVYLAALDNEQRRRINRFAAIDEELGNIAERPENLTTAVALNVLALLLPVAIARGARTEFMRRVLDPIPATPLEQRAAQEAANQASTRSNGVNRPPSGHPNPSERAIPSEGPAQQPGQSPPPEVAPPSHHGPPPEPHEVPTNSVETPSTQGTAETGTIYRPSTRNITPNGPQNYTHPQAQDAVQAHLLERSERAAEEFLTVGTVEAELGNGAVHRVAGPNRRSTWSPDQEAFLRDQNYDVLSPDEIAEVPVATRAPSAPDDHAESLLVDHVLDSAFNDGVPVRRLRIAASRPVCTGCQRLIRELVRRHAREMEVPVPEVEFVSPVSR